MTPHQECWMSGGYQHCVIVTCNDTETQLECETRFIDAVVALKEIFPVDP